MALGEAGRRGAPWSGLRSIKRVSRVTAPGTRSDLAHLIHDAGAGYVITHQPGELACFDAIRGTFLWQRRESTIPLCTLPIGVVVLASAGLRQELVVMDPGTGRLRPLDGFGPDVRLGLSPNVARLDERTFAAELSRRVIVFDGLNGATVADVATRAEIVKVVLDGSWFSIALANGDLLGLSRRGVPLWTARGRLQPIGMSEGRLYAFDVDKTLVAIAMSTGVFERRIDAPFASRSSSLLVTRDALLVESYGGLVALEPSSLAVLWQRPSTRTSAEVDVTADAVLLWEARGTHATLTSIDPRTGAELSSLEVSGAPVPGMLLTAGKIVLPTRGPGASVVVVD